MHGSRNTPWVRTSTLPQPAAAARPNTSRAVFSGSSRTLNLGEFRGDLGDPGLHLRSHLGEVLAQGLEEHRRLDGKRGQKKRCDNHRRTRLRRFGFATTSRVDGLLLFVFVVHRVSPPRSAHVATDAGCSTVIRSGRHVTEQASYWSLRSFAEYRFSRAISLAAASGARTPFVTISRFSSLLP